MLMLPKNSLSSFSFHTFLLLKVASKSPKIWATFVRNFAAQIYRNKPSLVTPQRLQYTHSQCMCVKIQTGFCLLQVQHQLNKKNCFVKRNLFCPFLKCPSLASTQSVKFIWRFFDHSFSMCLCIYNDLMGHID